MSIASKERLARVWRRDRAVRLRGLFLWLAVFLVSTGSVGMLTTALGPKAALATHSIPSPYRYYWDCNDDGYADDSCTFFRPGGPQWSQAQLDGLNAAFYHWRYKTDFDPYTNSNYTHEIFLQAQVQHLGCPDFGTWADNPGVLAIVCRITTWHPDPPGSIPAYYRIHDDDTFFNPNKNWWYGGGAPPSGTYHFQGVLTHEMGHWVRLVDLPCYAGGTAPTMCGYVLSAADTYDQRTLESDDVQAANTVYP